jgi:hypothetical protein
MGEGRGAVSTSLSAIMEDALIIYFDMTESLPFDEHRDNGTTIRVLRALIMNDMKQEALYDRVDERFEDYYLNQTA